MRELIERLSYRYRLWISERYGDGVGAGTQPLPPSPKSERTSAMIRRFLWLIVGGVLLLAGLGHVVSGEFPTVRGAILAAVIFLALVWSDLAMRSNQPRIVLMRRFLRS
jgi:hypothetical protein